MNCQSRCKRCETRVCSELWSPRQAVPPLPGTQTQGGPEAGGGPASLCPLCATMRALESISHPLPVNGHEARRSSFIPEGADRHSGSLDQDTRLWEKNELSKGYWWGGPSQTAVCSGYLRAEWGCLSLGHSQMANFVPFGPPALCVSVHRVNRGLKTLTKLI